MPLLHIYIPRLEHLRQSSQTGDKMKFRIFSFSLLALILPFLVANASADTVLGPDLSTFAVLGGTPVVSFAGGNDTITGNVGVSPAASITIAGTTIFTLTGT